MENYNSIEYAYKYREILKKALTDLESMKHTILRKRTTK